MLENVLSSSVYDNAVRFWDFVSPLIGEDGKCIGLSYASRIDGSVSGIKFYYKFV